MTHPLKQLASTGLIALACAVSAAHATDAYPNKPISMVIPFPAGGTTDIVARTLAQRLGEQLGTTVIVDNKPGAATVIGTQYVVRAKPDGYTLLLTGPSTFTANPAVNQQLPYDANKDLDPLGMVGYMPVILVANPEAGLHSVQALVEQAKQQPGKTSYGGFGIGSITQFAGEIFKRAAAIDITEVSYRGSAPALSDVMGGHIPVSFDTVVATAPHIRAGRLTPLAVTSAKRSSILPDVPTLQELGYSEVNVSSWLGLAAPAGMPDTVRAKIASAFEASMQEGAMRETFSAMGIEPMSGQSQEFVDWIANEATVFKDVAERAGLVAQP